MMQPADFLKGLSVTDFQAFGVEQLAYIRPMTIDGAAVFAICAADGRQLAVHDNQGGAIALTRQNELVPLTLQ